MPNITPTNFYSTVRRAIETRVNEQWASRTVISWPDVPFTPPTNTAWLKVSILHGDSFALSFGNNDGLNRAVGSIQLQVYVPRNQGTGASLDELAGVMRAMFSRYFGGGLECGASRDANDPNINGAWIVKTITTPFYVQEFVTTA